MNKVMFGALIPLLAAGLAAGCSGQADKLESNAAGASDAAAAAKPDDCSPGKGIRVGDEVAVKLAGNLAGTLPAKDLRWDTSGNFVTLVATGAPGSGKEVELVVSTAAGGPSPPEGECLRSGSYIRFASTHKNHVEPDRYLQAYRGSDHGGNPNRVVIGNFPDPSIHSTFFVLKASGPVGSVIERGDEVTIRGTQRDPWLFVPDDVAAGTPVGLVHHPEQDDPKPDVAKWTFGNKGDAN